MNATLEPPTLTETAEYRVVFHGVDWAFYEKVLSSLENDHLRVTYDRGTLEIMSPLPKHERLSEVIQILIRVLAFEMGNNICTLGSTTWKRADLDKGLEADKCFYIQNEDLVWNSDTFDLTVIPPPDLALEIDNTSSSMNRMGIYAALGIPEVWRFESGKLQISLLQSDRTYREENRSLAFPALPLQEFERFVNMRLTIKEFQLEMQFRDWVRQTLRK